MTQNVRDEIRNIQRHLLPLPCDVKWVQTENIHLTLKFLGDVPIDKNEAIIKAMAECLQNFSALDIELTQLGAYPDSRQPRVIWIGIDPSASKKIKEITGQLEDKLCQIGFPKEEREIDPHVTIGRIKSEKNLSLLRDALQKKIFSSPGIQQINSVTLFKSTLTSLGPHYEGIFTHLLKESD